VKGSHDLLYEMLGPPPYLGNDGSQKLQIWQADWTVRVVTKKCEIRSKGVVKGSRDLLF